MVFYKYYSKELPRASSSLYTHSLPITKDQDRLSHTIYSSYIYKKTAKQPIWLMQISYRWVTNTHANYSAGLMYQPEPNFTYNEVNK